MSNLAKQILSELSTEDKEIVRSWAEQAFIIRNDEHLDKSEKVKRLFSITNKNRIVFTFLKQLGLLIKKYSWDDRTWSSRLALSGLIVGLGLAGGKMAGVASAGIGIGVPIYLLTSAGGALLGTIINELKK